MSRTAKAHWLLLLVALIWGATFVTVKDALNDISPLLFNALRMALAFLCLVAFYPRELRRIGSREWRMSWPVGVLLFLGYSFQTTGLRLTTPSKSAFITGLSVVLVPLFLFALFRRKISIWAGVGVAAAFTGLAMLALPAGRNWSDLAQVNPGDWLTLACAIAFALQIIFLGRATQAVSFKAVAMLQTGIAAVLMASVVPLSEHLHVLWSGRVLIALVVTAVLATAAAFAIQSWAQQFTSATNTALIFTMEPVFALLTSYLVLQERLGGRALLGCGLILGGVLLSELAPHIKQFTRPT